MGKGLQYWDTRRKRTCKIESKIVKYNTTTALCQKEYTSMFLQTTYWWQYGLHILIGVCYCG